MPNFCSVLPTLNLQFWLEIQSQMSMKMGRFSIFCFPNYLAKKSCKIVGRAPKLNAVYKKLEINKKTFLPALEKLLQMQMVTVTNQT